MYKRIWCPDSFAPAIQNCKRISHAAQLLLHLANNTARTQIHNYPCVECGGYRQGYYGRIETIVFYLREERGRWRQGLRCLRCSKLRRIGGLGGFMMTPRRSSGCGACIPELTPRRHRGQLLCLGSRAQASTLQGRHRSFAGGSTFRMSFCGLLSLLATQQKWYHHLQQVVHTYTYADVPSELYVAHTLTRTVTELFTYYCTAVCTCLSTVVFI